MTKETLPLKGTKALRAYLEDDPNPPKASEILGFRKVCTEEEWNEYCHDAETIVNS